jgi:hypothetical protein
MHIDAERTQYAIGETKFCYRGFSQPVLNEVSLYNREKDEDNRTKLAKKTQKHALYTGWYALNHLLSKNVVFVWFSKKRIVIHNFVATQRRRDVKICSRYQSFFRFITTEILFFCNSLLYSKREHLVLCCCCKRFFISMYTVSPLIQKKTVKAHYRIDQEAQRERGTLY